MSLNSAQLNRLKILKADLGVSLPSLRIRMGSPFNILCPENPAPCKAATSVLTINPDGTVSPCDAFKRFRVADAFGNVLTHSLSQVWEDSYILNNVRKALELRSRSSCASCRFFTSCASGCLAQKAIEQGSIVDGKDPDCPVIPSAVVGRESEAITV